MTLPRTPTGGMDKKGEEKSEEEIDETGTGETGDGNGEKFKPAATVQQTGASLMGVFEEAESDLVSVSAARRNTNTLKAVPREVTDELESSIKNYLEGTKSALEKVNSPIEKVTFVAPDIRWDIPKDQDQREREFEAVKLDIIHTILAGLTLFAARVKPDNIDFFPETIRSGIVNILLAIIPEFLPKDFRNRASIMDDALTLDLIHASVSDFPLYLTAKLHQALSRHLTELMNKKRPEIENQQMIEEIAKDFEDTFTIQTDFFTSFVAQWIYTEENANASVGQASLNIARENNYLDMLRALARSTLPSHGPKIIRALADLRLNLTQLNIPREDAEEMDKAVEKYREMAEAAKLPKRKYSEELQKKLDRINGAKSRAPMDPYGPTEEEVDRDARKTQNALKKKVIDEVLIQMAQEEVLSKMAKKKPITVSRLDQTTNDIPFRGGFLGNRSLKDSAKLSSTTKEGATRLTAETVNELSNISAAGAGAGGGDSPGDSTTTTSDSSSSSGSDDTTSDEGHKKKKKKKKRRHRKSKAERRHDKEEKRLRRRARKDKKRLGITLESLNRAHNYKAPLGGHSYRNKELLKEQEHLKQGSSGASFADEVARTYQRPSESKSGLHSEIAQEATNRLKLANQMVARDISGAPANEQLAAIKAQLDNVTAAVQPANLRAFGAAEKTSIGIHLNDQYVRLDPPKMGRKRFNKQYKNDVFAVINSPYGGSQTEETDPTDYFEALHEVIDGQLDCEGARMLVKVTSKGDLRQALKSFPDNISFATIWRSLNIWFNRSPNFLQLEQRLVDLKKTQPRNISWHVRQIISTVKKASLAYPVATRQLTEVNMARNALEYLIHTWFPSEVDSILVHEAKLGDKWADERHAARMNGVTDPDILSYEFHPYLELADIMIRRIEMVYGAKVKQKVSGAHAGRGRAQEEDKGFRIAGTDMPPNIDAMSQDFSKLGTSTDKLTGVLEDAETPPGEEDYSKPLKEPHGKDDMDAALEGAGASAAGFTKKPQGKPTGGANKEPTDGATLMCPLCSSHLHRWYNCDVYPEGQRERGTVRQRCCGSYHLARCRKPFRLEPNNPK